MSGFTAPMGWSLAVPRLIVRRDGNHMRVSAPQIRFLTGKALEQLKNGANVGFLSQISLNGNESGSNVLSKTVDRFVVSYDVWEEKYSATRLSTMQQKSHLNVPAAESWCLDEPVPIPAALSPARPFWIKLELRTEDPKESAAIVGEPGINLRRLVEIFSRPPRNQQQWIENDGPFRLQDL